MSLFLGFQPKKASLPLRIEVGTIHAAAGDTREACSMFKGLLKEGGLRPKGCLLDHMKRTEAGESARERPALDLPLHQFHLNTYQDLNRPLPNSSLPYHSLSPEVAPLSTLRLHPSSWGVTLDPSLTLHIQFFTSWF